MDPRTEEMLAERRRQAKAAPPPTTLERALGEARKRLQGRRLTATLATAAAAVVLLWAYQVLVAKPAELRAKAEYEAQSVARMKVETTVRSAALEECLSTVKKEADTRWNAACRKRGQRAGCTLSAKLADVLGQEENRGRNACLLKFSVATQ